jgi:serine/threonine protein kinase
MHPAQLQPGYRLDRYELLCPLAYGGMASVWLARFGGRLGFERMVVIKMILPQFSQDPRFQKMFLDEARIVSKIEHPNVARILDVGEHQENYFIVMEWVDGDSLSKMIRAAEARQERVPPGIALRVIADAAAGLHAAHELKDRDGTSLGVVHRDVSPQNILIANNGATMLIDFGVAKARDRVSQETSAGQLKGKIRYMAPEQALGRSIDHRADVWALGALLYEIFTGTSPYEGPNEVATLHKLTSGQRPPPLPRSIPAVIRTVIERALASEPEKRFATALELHHALVGAMVEINEPTTPATVADYTRRLLADRKDARKRAVDAALDGARRRDQEQPAGPPIPPVPPSGDQLPLPASATFLSESNLLTDTTAEAPSAASGAVRTEAPSTPSATSSTFGSANMEYLPETPDPIDARRRRYFGAAALGVLLAGGTIGAILIITSLVGDKPKAHAGTSGSETPPAQVASTLPPPTPATTEAPPAEPTPAASTPTPPPPRVDPPPPPPPVRTAHRPTTPPPPKPKPTSGPAPTPTGKIDRGF